MTNNSLIPIFGEVLFDHFPDGSRVLGGAPFNVAWHTQAFGLTPLFISRVGDDSSGDEIAALMAGWNMSLEALQIDHEHITGSVQVQIENGEPHYEIVADSAYDYINEKWLAEQNTQGILYHGSLAIRNPVAAAALKATKVRHQGKIFIDVNLRSPWWEQKTLFPLLHDAAWVKLNEAELAELCPEDSDLETAIQSFCAKFNLETVIVTLGEKGVIAYDRQQRFVTVKPPVMTVVVDTVGAGDAFSAVLLLGFSKQWPLKVTLERAQDFAGALVGKRGAIITDTAFYRAFSERWD